MNILTLPLWLFISLLYLAIGWDFARQMSETITDGNPHSITARLIFAVNALLWPLFAVGMPLCALLLFLALMTLLAVLRVGARIGQVVAILALNSVSLLSISF